MELWLVGITKLQLKIRSEKRKLRVEESVPCMCNGQYLICIDVNNNVCNKILNNQYFRFVTNLKYVPLAHVTGHIIIVLLIRCYRCMEVCNCPVCSVMRGWSVVPCHAGVGRNKRDVKYLTCVTRKPVNTSCESGRWPVAISHKRYFMRNFSCNRSGVCAPLCIRGAGVLN